MAASGYPDSSCRSDTDYGSTEARRPLVLNELPMLDDAIGNTSIRTTTACRLRQAHLQRRGARRWDDT